MESVEEATKLLYAANKYGINKLDKLCEKYLMSIVSNDNMEELLTIADSYSLEGLRRICDLHASRPAKDKPAEWVRFESDKVPEGVVVAGYSKEGLPVCIGRTIYEGSLLPGAVDLVDEIITILHEGQVVQLKKFELLCNGNHFWSRSNLGQVLSDSVAGGATDLGETVYIGRVVLDGQLKIGKISPVSDHLFVPHGGKEVRIESGYQVLIEKPLNQI